MDKLDSLDNLDISLGFTNYYRHPTRKNYMIIEYKVIEHADYFESLIKEKKFFYERDEDSKLLFAVRLGDFDAVNRLNFETRGKFRKPMIRDKGARWVIVIMGFVLVLFAILSFLMS